MRSVSAAQHGLNALLGEVTACGCAFRAWGTAAQWLPLPGPPAHCACAEVCRCVHFCTRAQGRWVIMRDDQPDLKVKSQADRSPDTFGFEPDVISTSQLL